MKAFFRSLLLTLLLFSLCSPESYAQDRKLVVGRIINKDTKKPFPKDELIEIFAFDTEGLAEENLEVMKSGVGEISGHYDVMPPDESGYYQATLPETGALIFRVGIAEPILERVRRRDEINVSVDGGLLLEASTKVEKSTGISALEEEVQIDGNNLLAVYNFRVPENTGRSNARLILQPIFMDGLTNDTLAFLRPWIYDGEEYSLTQERRMGFRRSNDPLMKYVLPDSLTSAEFVIPWRDTVYLEDPRGRYYVKGKLLVEDYNTVLFEQDSIPMASSRARRPMQFLDYKLGYLELDHNEYRQRATPEKMETATEMSLTFVVNKAQIDYSDPQNKISLDNLRKTIYNIATAEDSKLREFHVIGISSPDGKYAKNLALSKERTIYAKNEVISVLPARIQRSVYQPSPEYRVAPWSDAAKLLERDGYADEAKQMMEIIDRTDKHDKQGDAIRELPFYRDLVSPRLPELRKVIYTYKHEETRELRPEESLDRYYNDEDYKSGMRHFRLYEYWNMFPLLTDDEEKEKMYKRAYDESYADNGTPWILAANNLAVSYLKKGIADTSILCMHIDERWKANRTFTTNGVKSLVNPEAVVANQLCMFLMSGQFSRASVMAQMLPDSERTKSLKALTMCLGGYYRGGKTDEERRQRTEWAETVMETSPRNKVVMLLAQNTRAYTAMAEREIENLPDDDALTWYFKAVVSSRKLNYPDAAWDEAENFYLYLQTCFDMDPTYIGIARTDGDIDEDEFLQFLKYYPQYDKF